MDAMGPTDMRQDLAIEGTAQVLHSHRMCLYSVEKVVEKASHRDEKQKT